MQTRLREGNETPANNSATRPPTRQGLEIRHDGRKRGAKRETQHPRTEKKKKQDVEKQGSLPSSYQEWEVSKVSGGAAEGGHPP